MTTSTLLAGACLCVALLGGCSSTAEFELANAVAAIELQARSDIHLWRDGDVPRVVLDSALTEALGGNIVVVGGYVPVSHSRIYRVAIAGDRALPLGGFPSPAVHAFAKQLGPVTTLQDVSQHARVIARALDPAGAVE